MGSNEPGLIYFITDSIGLAPIQKIAITEKYRPIYEKQAKENQSNAGGDRKSDEYKKSVTPNLGEAIRSNSNNETIQSFPNLLVLEKKLTAWVRRFSTQTTKN